MWTFGIRAGAFTLGMVIWSAAAWGQQDSEGWQDPYLTGDSALYPEPQAAETVPRAPDLSPDPSLAALPADADPLASGENGAVRIELMRVVRSDTLGGTPAPDGMQAVILVTRWTNTHPREQVERSKLQGKADRTYGAGGLFSGGGGAGAREMVDIDVAFKVPKAGQHAFLVAGGLAVDLRAESASLPNGIAADRAFAIARFNETREVRLGYFVPAEAAGLAFRFFDYANGHVTLAVAGDQGQALAPPDLAGRLAVSLPELELAVGALRFDGRYLDQDAPPGWRFALVEVFGRGAVAPGRMGAIAMVEPARSVWLAGDAGTVAWGLPPADGGRAIAFTPEFFQRRVFAFLVRADAKRFRLGLRGRGGAITVAVTAEAPAPMPAGVVTHADGAVAEISVLGLRWEAEHLVADLGVSPLAPAKGVELDLSRQFLLTDTGGTEVEPDLAATRRLTRRPPAPAVVPPGTPMRFELAFKVPADMAPALLRYRGFGGEAGLELSGLPVEGTRGVATADGTTEFPAFAIAAASPADAPEPEPDRSGSQSAASSPPPVAAPPAARFGPPEEPPRLMPVTLPDFDPALAVAEVEPNDKREEATPLGQGAAATGTIAGKDQDWFLLQVAGEPQLWTFEASGPGARALGIHRAGNARLVERRLAAGEASVRIDNILLLPGPYWLELRPTEAGGAYSVRAVALGRPDRYTELEPNDTPDTAHILHFGEPRRGLIGHKDDTDLYGFSLTQPTHLVVSVTPPPGKQLVLGVESSSWRVSSQAVGDAGNVMRYQALLGAGDYQLTLKARDGWRSDSPYEIRLDRLDPFVLPADLEPNDRSHEARRIGGLRRFQGSVGAFGRTDFYRLPPVTAETALTVTFESDSGVRPGLHVDKGDRTGSLRLEADRAQSTDEKRIYRAVLTPDGDGLFYVTGSGDYRVTLAYDPPPVEEIAQTADPAIELVPTATTPMFNAYGAELQAAPVTFSIGNGADTPQRVRLATAAGDSGWELDLEADALELAPGESRSVSGVLRALPDRPADRPVPIFLRAENESGAGATASLVVAADCDAPAVGPRRHEALPELLRGGLNLASTALGGEVVAKNDSARRGYAALFDGMTPLNGRYDISGSKMPFDVTVRLAGDGPAEVAGVTLFPRAAGRDQSNLGPFGVLASSDGQVFSPVFSGRLDRNEVEQAFVFDSPVRASHLRLRLARTEQLNRGGAAGLGEFKAIAVPGSRPLGGRELNIAAPDLGGHIVWASWEAGYRNLVAMLTEDEDARKVRIEALQPIEWVVGFHHQRAARITRLDWRDSGRVTKRDRRFESIKVSVSTAGPTGPWRPVADWTLARDGAGKGELALPAPVWARFLRFSAPGSDARADWLLPDTLRIFEQPAGDGYLSILGEWGHYARDAAFERTVVPESVASLEDRGGPGPDAATPLAVGGVLGGRVQVGADEDWFRIEVPEGMTRLEFAFDGAGAGRLIPTLQDGAGAAVALVEGDAMEGARVFHAEVTPGASYLLHVREATRAIMIVWDNSGSVSAYHATMYRAIARFVDDIRPGLEVVNLLPFRDRDPVPLLDDWTDDPVALKQAIGSYDRRDGSSESEKSLTGAMRALAERQGNRGILFLTDANSGGDRIAAEMWRLFHEVRPRVFAMELQLQAKDVDHFQDLMQDWAAVNDGHYAVFRNQADLDVAFDRAACHLRRPADYRVALRPGPGPGTLRVAWAEGKAMAGATVELIVDASGSMRSRRNKVNGRLKIDVAKEVMSEIVGLLPVDSQVGLRVYGHRKKEGTKGDCQDSQLVVRIGDLDRKQMLAAVKNIKALGTTPIAYSLQQAGKDLGRIEGPKLIVLVTDGKEECKGDPAAAVAELREQGIEVRLDIVGFALAEETVKEDMQRAAQAGGGRFFDAQDRDALAAAIRKTLAMPFEVLDGRGRPAVTGLTDQEPMTLYQGDYSVIVRTARGDVTIRDVPVKEGQATQVLLARDENGMTVTIDGPRAPN